jgi:predicted amidohydrolase YtcJ
MMRLFLLFFFATAIFFLIGCDHFKVTQVDMIVHNATIYQVDDAFSKADAMAIKDGKILAIGSEREIMNAYDSDVVVDAGKQAIFPGWIDAHAHFLAYGLLLQDADLKGTSSWDECLQRMQALAQKHPEGWLIGRGWDQNDWTETALPTKEKLDELFPNRPVWLTRIDGHAGIANQRALELSRIRPGEQVEGGQVVLLNNRLTGVLIDNAMNKVLQVIPARSASEKEQALLDAQQACWKVGLTSISEAGLDWNDITLIRSMYQKNRLQMHLDMWASDTPDNFKHLLNEGVDTAHIEYQLQGFKFYADGALGSRGACLLNPYTDLLMDGMRSYGTLLQMQESLKEKYFLLREKGFQVCTHAIGDSANRMVLQLYAQLLEGTNDRRWRIEHAQVVDPSDIHLFGQFNILPSVQPSHATSDAPWAWERLGKSRVRNAYRYKTLMGQNGMLALGTDFPIEDIDPLDTFYSAVFRKSRSNKEQSVFQVEEALTREEAIRGMTIWPAIAMRRENKYGSLEVGKQADFVMMDMDLMTATEEQLRNAKVISTYTQGQLRCSN